MYILGVSAYYHDAAAVLLKAGRVVAAAQQERFSRRKHDPQLPKAAIEYCLKVANIGTQDLEAVVYYEKPLRKFERILSTQLATVPKSFQQFGPSMFAWLSSKLWVKTNLSKLLRIDPTRILFTDHHMSHAASAFLCSPFDDAAVLVMDGVGEWATTTLYRATRAPSTRIVPLMELQFPHSLGLLYSTFTAWLGFEVNEGEYKVMGMAPYGRPRYVDKVRKLLIQHGDGSFNLDLDYFTFHYHPSRSFSDRFVAEFGPPRDARQRFVTTLTGTPADEPAPSQAELDANQYFADVAASVQQVTEELVLELVKTLYEKTGLSNLCMAGGVALNSVANGRVLRESPFQQVFIQPAAGDAGGALGAALYAWEVALGRPRAFTFDRCDWGQQASDADITEFLTDFRVKATEFEDESQLTSHVAERLQKGEVMGWVQGRFEWGPRALGQRSILADPRRADMKERVNRTVKYREPFRPFAPSTLTESASDLFKVAPQVASWHPEHFMLTTARVRDEHRMSLQAVTHVDGSARIQRVSRELNPRYYALISAFGSLSGIPVLLNTSFNLKGEPIVNTPLEAYATFQRSNLDALVIDRWVIDRTKRS